MKNTYCPFYSRPKNLHLLPLLIPIFFFLFQSSLPAQLPDWAQQISPGHIVHSVNSPGNHVFELDNIPNNIDEHGISRGYFYVWFFDDGTYLTGELPPLDVNKLHYDDPIESNKRWVLDMSGGSSTTQFPGYKEDVTPGPKDFKHKTTGINNSSSPNKYVVTLKLFARYRVKKPAEFTMPTNQGAPQGSNGWVPEAPSQPSSYNSSTPGFLHLSSFSNPVIDDSLTYVINYETCEPNGYLYFDFTHQLAQIEEGRVFTYHNELVEYTSTNLWSDAVAAANNGTQPLRFKLPRTTGTIFIRLNVPNTTPPGSNIAATVNLVNSTIDSTQQEIKCDLLKSDTQSVDASSHDPNEILSITGMCLPPPAKMSYTIVFQNIGDGSAKNVMVRNPIPLDFDPATLVTIDPPGLLPTYDPTSRTYTWNLNHNKFLKNARPLEGTASPLYMIDFSEDATKDSITYEIEFYPDSLPTLKPCEMIVSRAEIIFDCHKSIFTNTFRTEFMCCQGPCDTCVINEYNFEPVDTGVVVNDPENEIIIDPELSRQFSASASSSISTSSFVWYPSESVRNSSQRSTTIKDNTIPSAIFTSVENCIRTESIFPVMMADKTPPCGLVAYEDPDYDDCCTCIRVNCSDSTPSFNWEYTRDGIPGVLVSTDSCLYLKNVTTAKVTVTDGRNEVIIYPNLSCPDTGRSMEVKILFGAFVLLLFFLLLKSILGKQQK
ncbi:MAG: hypothetical protein AAFZ15_14555 [Bacteroidota bacterium]